MATVKEYKCGNKEVSVTVLRKPLCMCEKCGERKAILELSIYDDNEGEGAGVYLCAKCYENLLQELMSFLMFTTCLSYNVED